MAIYGLTYEQAAWRSMTYHMGRMNAIALRIARENAVYFSSLWAWGSMTSWAYIELRRLGEVAPAEKQKAKADAVSLFPKHMRHLLEKDDVMPISVPARTERLLEASIAAGSIGAHGRSLSMGAMNPKVRDWCNALPKENGEPSATNCEIIAKAWCSCWVTAWTNGATTFTSAEWEIARTVVDGMTGMQGLCCRDLANR